MTTPTLRARARNARGKSLRRAGRDLAVGLLPLLAVSAATWQLFDLPAAYLLQAVALYAFMAGLILWYVPTALPGQGLGAANRVSLARATLLLPVAALVPEPSILTDAGYWWIIAVSTIVMIVDGVDGWIARRTGTSTAFGGRFDVELDAFLLLALSGLVLRADQTGFWVILIGALRYLFVATGWIWPALRAELPPSQRRRIICVVQGVALLVCLGPIVPSGVAPVTAAGALLLLTYSFAVDVWWFTHNPIGFSSADGP